MVTTLTSKGQLTVPLDIRQRLRLHPGDKVDFVVTPDGRVEFVPVRRSIRELYGCLKPSRHVTLEEMDPERSHEYRD
jgi:AbrB family looped-hinge helix DNA binding protein